MARAAIPPTQNLLLWSEAFDNATWFKSGVTVTANATVAPDGTESADAIVEDGLTTPHLFSDTRSTLTPVNRLGQRLVASIHAKAAGRTKIQAWVNNTGTNAATFDLAAGTVSGVAAGVTATIASLGDGWYRCTVAWTLATVGSHWIRWYAHNNVGVSYTGTDGLTAWYAWGASASLNRASAYVATGAAAVDTGPLRPLASGRVAASGRAAATGRVAP